MAYSKDYRRRAVEYKNEGHTFEELRETFKIPPITYYDWKEKLASGYYEERKVVERKRLIDKEKLALAVKERPDAYLKELAESFGCTAQAVFYRLKKMKITLKKDIHLLRKIRRGTSRVYRETGGNTDRNGGVC